MKNIQSIAVAILSIAVAILFYLQLKSPSTKKTSVANTTATTASGNNTETIAFVNTDTLLANYDFFKKSKKEMEAQQKSMEQQLESQGQALQREFNDAQSRVSSMTASEAQATEERLGKKQQDLMQKRDAMSEQFSNKMDMMNEKLNNKIHDYLILFNKDKNYKYILSYTKAGGGILYADDALDITKEVLDGMNEEYKNEKK